MNTPENQPKRPNQHHEPEFEGSFWKHPFAIFVILNFVLFVFLIVVAALAYKFDWIPHR